MTLVNNKEILHGTDVGSCKFCGSTRYVNAGARKTTKGLVAKFQCKSCKRVFSRNPLKGARIVISDDIIEESMNMYVIQGMPAVDITHYLKNQYNIKISRTSIVNWYHKYVRI